MPLEATLERVLTDPRFLVVWGVLVASALSVLLVDLRRNNHQLPSLMKAVWALTVLYSGPIGLTVYWYTGRRQIAHDSIWRRGFRSVAHCYSGCGAGEITGIVLTVGILALDTAYVVVITFAFAYTFGFALTVGPLMQDGVPFHEAVADAFYSETPSIVVMEVVAIGVDLWLAGEATMGDPLFWSSLVFSLSIGFFAAYPVNVGLIAVGVKEGMSNPAAS